MNSFKHLKVVELASVLAGPSVGAFFAELGATVIKIENPKTKGDVTRSWRLKDENECTNSTYFSSVNFGKFSVALNIAHAKGLSVLYQIIKDADIVISSYKPGDAEKLGVAYADLIKVNPTIIYGHITGYGDFSERAGYDAIIQAESGFMEMNGTECPTKMPVALMDVLAGHQLKEGILVALIEKGITGEGKYVPVSLYQSAISGLANQASNFLMTHLVPERMGSDHPNIVPYGTTFSCKHDERIVLAVGSDVQYAHLTDILGIENKFKTNAERVLNRAEVNTKIQNALAQVERNLFIEKCHLKKVPVGELNTLADVFKKQISQNMVHQSVHEKAVRQIAFNQTVNIQRKPPQFGQDTRTICQLYLTEEEIEQLIDETILFCSE